MLFESLAGLCLNCLFCQILVYNIFFSFSLEGSTSTDGFAAIKLTALGRPQLLVGLHCIFTGKQSASEYTI